MNRRSFVLLTSAAVAAACTPGLAAGPPDNSRSAPKRFPVTKTDAEWKKLLTPEQYDVLRNKGTERAFTGAYWNEHRKGTYACAGCATKLFASETKFESGTGWPSFWDPLDKKVLYVATDNTYGMSRDEVMCATCGGHLGHVFNDGPKPTGQRYCMNSAALTFDPAKA